MTLELTSPSKWAVRVGSNKSAEIAKYRLKGILYWYRQKCPTYKWVKVRGRLFGGIIRGWMTQKQASVIRRHRKPVYRWERRK